MKYILFFLTALMAFNIPVFGLSQDNDAISKFTHLSTQQLLDTATYYFRKNSNDTALIYYSLLINTPVKDTDIEGQKKIIKALNISGIIYRYMCDYQESYNLLIKALDLCDTYQLDQYKAMIYTNIGDIYYRFKKYDMAISYTRKALDSNRDSISIIPSLNNLGFFKLGNEEIDSVLDLLNRALQINKRHNSMFSASIYNSIALFYEKTKQYDSAFHYFRLSMNESGKDCKFENEVENLSCLGKLFFEINKIDSALFYIDLSNIRAKENGYFEILADNYLTLSKIEELKGHSKDALQYFKKYANLKDSILNVDRFGEINQLQRLYEVSKTNQQIEQLAIEQRIKERTIRYQKIILFIVIVVLLLVSGILLVVFLQKRKLNRAYKTLFDKNIEIIDLQKNLPEEHLKKYRKSALADDMQDELIDKILTVMEDIGIICDAAFSINKLAVLVQSNYNYVSQTINTVLNKNFRSLLNSYRIKEAQRLFSEPDAAKYTIESVALQVGFKSRSAFRDAFKEVTGVSPSFYLKSVQKQCDS